MRKSSLLQDLAITIMVLLGVALTYYLFTVGIGMILVLGFVTPGWAILVFMMFMIFKYKNK